jgi:hypothetical protein
MRVGRRGMSVLAEALRQKETPLLRHGGPAALLVLAGVALLGAGEARAYQPLPWDAAPGLGPVYSPSPRGERSPYGTGGSRELFGTGGAMFDYNVHFDGHISGIADGRGYTFEIPATLPGWLVYALVVNPMSVFSTLTPEAWTSGYRGSGLRTSPLFDEIDFELLYSVSSHDDRAFGGELDYTRVGLGVRVSGPAPPERLIRTSLVTGWTWHSLDFDRRDDRTATGVYLGLGFEARFAGGSGGSSRTKGRDSMTSVRLGVRCDFVRGLDGAGDDFDATVFTAGAGFSFYW